MQPIDNGIKSVRKRPRLYLRDGVFSPEDVSGRLVSQALVFGAKKVEVFHHRSWWRVLRMLTSISLLFSILLTACGGDQEARKMVGAESFKTYRFDESIKCLSDT